MDSTLLQTVDSVLAEIAAEYAEKGHLSPRAFVFSQGTTPVRIDPDFSLPVDISKAEFIKAVRQAAKRLQASGVLTVSETWLAALLTASAFAEHGPKASQHPNAVEAIVASLEQRLGTRIIWIAPIYRPERAKPFLQKWIEAHPQKIEGALFDYLSTN